MSTAVRTLTAAVADYRAALADEARADDVNDHTARVTARLAARARGEDVLAELERGHGALVRLLQYERATERCLWDPSVTIEDEPAKRVQRLRRAAEAIDAVQRYLADADADGTNILG